MTSVTSGTADIAIYLHHLKALPFVQNAVARSPTGREGGSVTVDVTARRKKHTFEAGVLRTNLSMAEVERWIGKAKNPERKRPLLLLAPFVSRPMGARLREAGVHYLDQVGNMHLELRGEHKGGDAFVALVEGKRPVQKSRGDAAWRAPSYQVLLAFLVRPTLLGASVRTIATQAGVSTSPVLQVQKKLVQQGLAVQQRGEWQWTPRGWTEARDFWLHGYHSTLRPHLLIGRFRARGTPPPEALEKDVAAALGGRYELRWGGAAAANRLDSYYRGDRTVVHLDGEGLTVASLASTLRMVPDADGALILLRVPGPCALSSPDESTIGPLIAWAELLEEGHDRSSEAAERLLNRFLIGPRTDAH